MKSLVVVVVVLGMVVTFIGIAPVQSARPVSFTPVAYAYLPFVANGDWLIESTVGPISPPATATPWATEATIGPISPPLTVTPTP